MRKTIGIFLCLILVFSIVDVSFAGTYLGSTKNGWVEKEIYGNQASSQTIVIITGIHPREYQFHEAVRTALKSKSGKLIKKYVLYRVHVTKNPMNYNKGRMSGQILANKYVVPDVKRIKPRLAIDIHECNWKFSGYKYGRFFDPISKTYKTKTYAYYLASKLSVKVYSPRGGTSPKYVTNPLARKGIPTLVYETYKKDPYSRKLSDAKRFIDALERM